MDQMTENALAVCTIFFGDILTFSNITPKKLVRVSMIIFLTISMQVINQEIQQLQPHSHRLEHTGQGRRGLQFVIRRICVQVCVGIGNVRVTESHICVTV